MSAEIHWISTDGPVAADPRPKCRYCVRALTSAPATPAEIEPHCPLRGCRVCAECATGQTSVSPVRS